MRSKLRSCYLHSTRYNRDKEWLVLVDLLGWGFSGQLSFDVMLICQLDEM